jgi:cysteine desulfurase / selenocysteine lyase
MMFLHCPAFFFIKNNNLFTMIDWEKIRAKFPAASNYVYLNCAGGAPMSDMAANEGKRFYDEMLSGGDTYWDEWLIRKEKVREKLAGFINANPQELAFTLNTSHGMGQIAAMLEGVGDVLTMHDEFPSTTFPFLHLGFNLKYVTPENGIYSIENIEKNITPNTRILVSSYIQYNTGFKQNLTALGELCRKHQLIFVVNATQGIGAFPVDVEKIGADFMVFTCLKWTLAGYGIGGLYINKKWLGNLPFPAAGWRSTDNPEIMNNRELTMKSDASATEVGCSHFPNIFALGGAIDLLNEIGQENVTNHILALNDYLEKGLKEIGIEILSITKPEHRSGITIINVDNPKKVAETLFEQKIYVSVRGEGLRISFHIYNNQSDVDRLIEGLSKINRQQGSRH